jgi:hypothetical protein
MKISHIFFVFSIYYFTFLLYKGIIRCTNTVTFNIIWSNKYLFYFKFKKCYLKFTEENKLSNNIIWIFTKKCNYFSFFNCIFIENNENIDKNTIWFNRYFDNYKKTIHSFFAIINLTTYFYTNNPKTDIITIFNDIEICYNNVCYPLYYIIWGILCIFLFVKKIYYNV